MSNLLATNVTAIQSEQLPVTFAWLEITNKCQLTCEHCYAGSGPRQGHGKLGVDDWKRAIGGLRSLGVNEVQFIGGEPTAHPAFCELVDYAVQQRLSVEVYSNLVSISRPVWNCLVRNNVKLATSFYSAKSDIHDAITDLRGSQRKTIKNISKAIELGLPLRAGIIDIRPDQDIDGAEQLLVDLGLDRSRIRSDRVRGVGRGAKARDDDPKAALCGRCASGVCAITSEVSYTLALWRARSRSGTSAFTTSRISSRAAHFRRRPGCCEQPSRKEMSAPRRAFPIVFQPIHVRRILRSAPCHLKPCHRD